MSSDSFYMETKTIRVSMRLEKLEVDLEHEGAFRYRAPSLFPVHTRVVGGFLFGMFLPLPSVNCVLLISVPLTENMPCSCSLSKSHKSTCLSG